MSKTQNHIYSNSFESVSEVLGVDRFAKDVREGLLADPKTLPCKYFYDEEGSRLFEKICDLPEYYLTRTEDSILRDNVAEMVEGWHKSPALVELGSGSSSKTRRLIAAAIKRYGALGYFPIDVSLTILEESARNLKAEFSELRVQGFAGDYRDALGTLCGRIRRPKLILFLGSSLGNYARDEAITLLREVASVMSPDDRFLLGTDLVKDPICLEPAYDDAAGITAAFNRNLLTRINRELGADFDLDQFRHRALYREDLSRIEMHLVARSTHTVTISKSRCKVTFVDGESIHTENSHKYTVCQLRELADLSGFKEEASWTDPLQYFRLQRWRVA
jgi:L-histidine N-alpha-methyltransferase